VTDTLRASTASERRPRKMAEEQSLTKGTSHGVSATSMERLGVHVSRYGLVLTLLLIGALKFTAGEAQGIQPLVANSPLMFWLYRIFSLQGVSNLIGVIEIVVALLIALRPLAAKLSFVGRHWRRHHVRLDSEFSLIDAGGVPVLPRPSLVRGCWPIPHQGSRSSRGIDLDRRRGAVGRLGSPSVVVKPFGLT
jgi:Protein of unknown function, DUF417